MTADNETMRQALTVKLTDYIDEQGRFLPAGDRTQRLAEFLTQLVARVTMAYGLHDPLGVLRCRHKRCRGLLQIHFNDDGAIGWYCSNCDDTGWVTHWRRTFFDLLDATWSETAPLSWTDEEERHSTH